MLRPYNFQPIRDIRPAEEANASSSSDSEEEHVNRHEYENRTENSNWCSCACCAPMPKVPECICCKEISEVRAKMGNYPCITDHRKFNIVCLDTEVLWTAMVGMNDVVLATLEQPISNR